MAKQTKYRPSLTASQIIYILDLTKGVTPMTVESYDIIRVLSSFQNKIANDAIAPAYIATNKPASTSLEALGGDSIASIDKESYPTKEVYWEVCYNKYKLNPTSCSLTEIQASQEWRYLNDLMTPEEQAAYDLELFNSPS